MAKEIKKRERAESFFLIEDSLTNTIVRRLYISQEKAYEAMFRLEPRGQFSDWHVIEFRRVA